MYDTMLFTKTINFDQKGRFFLPAKNVGLEAGEKIYLFYSDDHSCVIARSEESIQRLGRKYIDADPKEREEKLEELGDFLINSIGVVTVDGQKRLSLGIKVCAEAKLIGSAFVVGCFDELRFYPSKEAYQESLQAKKDAKLKQLGSK